MSHIYRAYHAIQGLTNREGLSTNAVFGFTTMLRKLIAEERPEFIGVAIDPPGPTIRHEQFEEYKATRAPMPEDLKEQIPLILEVCRAFRIPILTFENYEADDVIGTLADKAASHGLDVVIVTIDKDLFQLVNDRIQVLDTRSMKRFNAAAVQEKLGVPPERVVDVLSLVGDSSDNIPGAAGIGAVGAQSLIREFGSLENLLERRQEVARKSYRESLMQNEAAIIQSRELLSIHRNLPIDLDLDQLRLSEPDSEAAAALFAKLGFNSLLEEFLSAEQSSEETSYEEVRTSEELTRRLENLRGRCYSAAVKYSPGSRPEIEPEALAICMGRGQGWYAASEAVRAAGDRIFELLLGDGRPVFHDLKPLLSWGRQRGRRLAGDPADTMLMAYLLSPHDSNYSLEHLALKRLQYRFREAPPRKSLFEEPSPHQLSERADVTLRLFQQLEPELEATGLAELCREIEIPLVEVLADMEVTGVQVDAGALQEMSVEFEGQIERLTAEIFALAGEEFNLNSPKQLAEVLFERLQLPTSRKTGKAGHYSTGVEVLEELAVKHEIAQRILDYRELTKLKNTYLDALPKLVHPSTGRIHTSFNQMVTATGRLSSSNPNLQNIPIRGELGRRIRRAFVARPGFQILAADYSQIELRVMAHLSGDPVLTESFRRGEDIHQRTALEVFGEASGLDPQELRRRAKIINFGIMYGLSAFGLAKSLKIDRTEAQQIIDDYFRRYQGVQRWIDQTVQFVEEKGYVVTLFGRIRHIPEIRSKNWNLREFAKRTAINAPIQGTSADLIKKAMVAIFDRLEKVCHQSKLVLQVHDELVFEVVEEKADAVREMVVEEMEGAARLDVPLQVDVGSGKSWYEAK
jgi:DNA polymerase I